VTDLKEITARAWGIVERLGPFSAIEKAEIVAIVQTIVNVELQRTLRPQPPAPQVADE
jgi:hypothetical protein